MYGYRYVEHLIGRTITKAARSKTSIGTSERYPERGCMVEITSAESVGKKEVRSGVHAAQLGYGERLHAQKVEFEPGAGGTTPHDHPHEQITYITAGELILRIDGEDHHLSEGDTVIIPGDVPHAARNESEDHAALLDVFSPPRDDLME